MSENIRVAIDGPSGAGKSTLARSVAARLNFLYVDTGAIYRTIGYAVWRKGIDPRDRSAVVAVLPDLEICLTYGTDGLQHMELNGMDVTAEIRLPEVSRYASLVSAYPEVRAYLLEMQRQLARENSVVMDGRDIGTCVLPEADVKVYLTASSLVRARRRYRELTEKGIACDLKEIEQDILDRDHRDMHREHSPLVQAEDAVYLDSSDMTLDQVVDAIGRLIDQKMDGQAGGRP